MDEDVTISGGEDETCPELEGILSEPVLPVAGSFRAGSRDSVIAAQEMEQVPRSQPRGFVGCAPGIDQERECDPGLFAKQSGIVHVSKSDRGQSRPGLLELILVLAQLRDVLAAEDSAVVPQKDNHGGTLLPQRAESHFTAARLWQHELRKLNAERFRHGAYCIGPGRCSYRSFGRDRDHRPQVVASRRLAQITEFACKLTGFIFRRAHKPAASPGIE